MAHILGLWHPTQDPAVYFIPDEDIISLEAAEVAFTFVTTQQLLLYCSTESWPEWLDINISTEIAFLFAWLYWTMRSFGRQIGTLSMLGVFKDITLLLLSINCVSDLTHKNEALLSSQTNNWALFVSLRRRQRLLHHVRGLEILQIIACLYKHYTKAYIYSHYAWARTVTEPDFGIVIRNSIAAIAFKLFDIVNVTVYMSFIMEIACGNFLRSLTYSPFTLWRVLVAVVLILLKAFLWLLAIIIYDVFWLTSYPMIPTWRPLNNEGLYFATSLVTVSIGLFWNIILMDLESKSEEKGEYTTRTFLAAFITMFVRFAVFHVIFHGCRTIQASIPTVYYEIKEKIPKIIDVWVL